MNTVEKEGVSLRHTAKVVSIGSSDPEEREIKAQLFDMFGNEC
jgi:Mg-chelatase subunit ChlI